MAYTALAWRRAVKKIKFLNTDFLFFYEKIAIFIHSNMHNFENWNRKP